MLALIKESCQSKRRTKTSSGRLSSGSFGSGHLINKAVQIDRIYDWGMKERRKVEALYILSRVTKLN